MFVLYSHCNITSSSISYHGDEANSILHPKYLKPAEDNKSKVNPGSGEEENTHFIKVFEGLSKDIRNLNDLPLSINSIQGIDPVFRSTEVRNLNIPTVIPPFQPLILNIPTVILPHLPLSAFQPLNMPTVIPPPPFNL